MAKRKGKFPSVFLACPFDKNMKKLKSELDRLPWKVVAANERIKNDFLLKKITKDIKKADYALFDISGWNPNVCLELGLAEGLKKKYYIMNNNSYKKDAISDIKGIERVDYNWNKKKKAAPLYEQIKEGIFKKKFYTSTIWKVVETLTYPDKKFTLALRILSSFKIKRKKLTKEEIKKLARGLNFKKPSDIEEVVDCLSRLKLFKRIQKSGSISPRRRLYRG